jgi:hypothetical protein
MMRSLPFRRTITQLAQRRLIDMRTFMTAPLFCLLFIGLSLAPEDNTPAAHVVRRQVDSHPIPGPDAHKTHPHRSSDRRHNHLSVIEFDLVARVWQSLAHYTPDTQTFVTYHGSA